jgi:hypothetical protein
VSWQDSLDTHLKRAFPAPEELVLHSPTVLGSSTFGVALASPTVGIHLFARKPAGAFGEGWETHAPLTAQSIRARMETALGVAPPIVVWSVTEGDGESAPPWGEAIAWPPSRGCLRSLILDRGLHAVAQLDLRTRLRAWHLFLAATRSPIGAFDASPEGLADPVEAHAPRPPLRLELDTLRDWLQRRGLDEAQSCVTRHHADLIVIEGLAGSGKSTVLAHLAATTIEHAARLESPQVALLGTTRDAARALASRTRGVLSRRTGIRRLPTWVSVVPLAELEARAAASGGPRRAGHWTALFLDEAQLASEDAVRMAIAGLRPTADGLTRLGIALDPLQAAAACRLHPDTPPLNALASPAFHAKLDNWYRTPRPVLEFALNVAQAWNPQARDGAGASDHLLRWTTDAVRSGRLGRSDDGWLRVSPNRIRDGAPAPIGGSLEFVPLDRAENAWRAVLDRATEFRDRGARWAEIVVVVADDEARLALRGESLGEQRKDVRVAWRRDASAANAQRDSPHAERARPRRAAETRAPMLRVLTAHEARGGDWPLVVALLPESPADPGSRMLAYVAFTRAQHQLVVVSRRGSEFASIAERCVRRAMA